MNRLAFATLAALVIAYSSAGAQGTDWSASVGLDAMSGRHAQGAAKSFSFARRLGAMGQYGDLGIAFNWVRGSGDYSPFSCHLARQIYCFGGSERLTAMSIGLQLADRPRRVLGVEITPVGSIGLDRSQSEVSELEGPTTLCFVDGELVSCADNPPFTNFYDTRRAILPFYAFGFDVSRPVGRVTMRAGVAAHQARWFNDDGHGRLRFSLGVGF